MLAGLSEWLDAFGQAWKARDAQAAADLFTEDATYQWGPFASRQRGQPLIREAFAEAFEGQGSVAFGYEVLAATNRGGIVRWWSTVDHTRLEGIFRLHFEDSGLCTSLEAWWNADAAPNADET